MNKGKRFIEKYRHGFPKKSQGRYSTKMYLCTVILLMAMVLGICTSSDLLQGKWPDTEAATTDPWNGTNTDNSWLDTGDGSEANPYIITTAEQLANLASSVNSSASNSYSGKYFKLGADLDLNGSETQQWTPIGNYVSSSYYYFGGNFDGDGHTISNLYIDSVSYKCAGLFGYISGATISNLNVNGRVSNTYSSNYSTAGGIVGYANNSSTIEYCTSSVRVSAEQPNNIYAGGIVGYLYAGATVQYCYNTGSVTATQKGSNISSAGGIVGGKGSSSSTSYITGCYNTGTVTADGGTSGTAYAGGLCGINRHILKVEYSYNVGTVSASSSKSSTTYIGGLVGGTDSSYPTAKITITNSYWREGCGASYDYSGSVTTDGKKTEAELKSAEVLGLLNDGEEVYQEDTKYVNAGYPIFIFTDNQPQTFDEIYINGTSGNDSNTGADASNAVKTMTAAFAKLNPGGTVKVCETVVVSDTDEWDGENLMSGDQKVTIEENTEGLTMFDVTGTLTVKDLNFRGSGTAINNSGTVSLNNVEFDVSTSIASTGIVNVSGKVVIPKVDLSSTDGKIVLTGDLTTVSSIAIQGAGNGHEVVGVDGGKNNFSSAEMRCFTVVDSDNYRLVTKASGSTTEFTALYYYGNPTWSVDINTGTPGEIKLKPTLTNFVDGDYGDKLEVKILYPEGANGFSLVQSQSDADYSVACRFSLDNNYWFTGEDRRINFTSNDNDTKTLYYAYDSGEPKYSGDYTGKVKFQGTLTQAT